MPFLSRFLSRPVFVISQELLLFQALQSGGPRTTPSGYPGGPIVPSGHMSPQMGQNTSQGRKIKLFGPSDRVLKFFSSSISARYVPQGYMTTGRLSTHQQQQAQQQQQQQPLSFTRALEVSESIEGRGGGQGQPQSILKNSGGRAPPASGGGAGGGGDERESVYDMNAYEISV